MNGIIDSTADLPVGLRSPIGEVLDRLNALAAEHTELTFANRLGAEDMVLADLIAPHWPGITVFSLDAGRLPEATYAMIDEVRERYGLPVQVFYAEREALDALVREPRNYSPSRRCAPSSRPMSSSTTACCPQESSHTSGATPSASRWARRGARPRWPRSGSIRCSSTTLTADSAWSA